MSVFNLRGKSFAGGVHPADEKALTRDLPITPLPDPEVLLVPIAQHLGRPAAVAVKKGEWVREGQIIATAQGGISAHIRAPRAGTVTAIQNGGTANGLPALLIALKPGPPPPTPEGQPEPDRSPVRFDPIDPASADPAAIVERVREAGIVGQGGAAFPTAVKLSPPAGATIDTLIVNGCECEPYLTRDYRLMIEHPRPMLEGAALAALAVQARRIVIGVEDNKPAAVASLQQALQTAPPWVRTRPIEILALQTKYPQGAEKMLIEAVTGRQVAPGQLPASVGIAIQNVGTVIAMRDAVIDGRPQTDAILTVSGRGVVSPANVQVPIGMSIAAVLDACGGLTPETSRIVVGGPMMGVAQHDIAAPVVKACSGILALTAAEVGESRELANCVRCGRCTDACPIHLVPSRLARLAEFERAETARDEGIEVCMECGTCAFACPSRLPLVQWLRLGKQLARNLSRSA